MPPSAGLLATVFTAPEPHRMVPKSPKKGLGRGQDGRGLQRIGCFQGCGRGRGRSDAEGKSRRQIKGGSGPLAQPGQGRCQIGTVHVLPLPRRHFKETPESSQSRPAAVENQTPSQPQVGKAMRRRGPPREARPGPSAARSGSLPPWDNARGPRGLSRERGRRRLGRPHGQLASGLETGGGAIWIEQGRLFLQGVLSGAGYG